IAARAQSLLREERHPERRLSLEAIHQQAMRAHEMISDLMLFARPPKLDVRTFDLSALLQDIADNFVAECNERQISLHLEIPKLPVEIPGDRQQLAVAISALCTNAMEAIGSKGTVQMVLNEQPAEATLEVSDTGPGISPEVRKHLFDPFYSGREAGRGLGFGLSKCWRIVTDHGGTIVVSSKPQQGATFFLTLPIHRDAVE
ncbi:MAG: HAMP domain-containing histidine kinase, partial [Pirellulales bacterium]|nr:HAMP domain-containing histidine kinase [Pirellulales bacterium]